MGNGLGGLDRRQDGMKKAMGVWARGKVGLHTSIKEIG